MRHNNIYIVKKNDLSYMNVEFLNTIDNEIGYGVGDLDMQVHACYPN